MRALLLECPHHTSEGLRQGKRAGYSIARAGVSLK